ncbi:SDR family oxidoreductase [Methyloligella sp. 2.7D]|uniref:SDR family oxidoreductase n=1 Tax=unclassified Methyloligella TaxID=2625955 RepID=UPI00157CCD44|nr:SDR family oxidoreductase [Methyloligella sp. GL2]QKP76111.1 SDR family oxidoreductase [Methyloligella sp. GL2]
MIVVTGASGQLGRLVVAALRERIPANQIVAVARNTDKIADLAAEGVVVRHGDYDAPETLGSALEGAEKLLLISSNEVGRRAEQHKAVIEAAKTAGVSLVAYTSILHADISPLILAEEHRATEAMLKQSGLPYALLRNSWYTENYLLGVPVALKSGTLYGATGEGKISTAPRADYAEAAAVVLTAAEPQAGRVYELAGDEPYTLAQFAAELSRQSGKEIAYQNLSEADYAAALVSGGMPELFATVLAQSDACAAKDALFDDSRQLSTLIGRPTTPLSNVLAAALKG